MTTSEQPSRLTPSAVANHLACPHLTQLDRARREGRLSVSMIPDPRLEAFVERGLRQEKTYVDRLLARDLRLLDLRDTSDPAQVVAAMQDGCDVIVQAPLENAAFRGRADVLLRVDEDSRLGSFAYEPVDTKLSQTTRPGTILQLCVYAELLGEIQGQLPRRLHVVTPAAQETYRTADFSAYFRFVRSRHMEALQAEPPPATYPEPVAHCDACAYWAHCREQRRADDHLSLVAGIHTLHSRELVRQGITTVKSLATSARALPTPPERGTSEVYSRLAHQAGLQVRARTETGRIPFDVLQPEPSRGLCRLPEPSFGDVFLDFEGDPFVEGGGVEYLTGWVFRDEDGEWHYDSRWASGRADEKLACETFIDFVIEQWASHPGVHVYHYGAYEPAALKRLASRHTTRTEELDRMLRSGRFVDLHAVVRQGLRIGIERYGLKELEPLHRFERLLDLRDAGRARMHVEIALEIGTPGSIDDEDRGAVVEYNREDCLSTAALQTWLEEVRATAAVQGNEIPRPIESTSEASDAVSERDQKIQDLAEALLANIPADPVERTADQQAQWMLANLLGYFRREEKCAWWEVFRLHDLDGAQLTDERDGIGGLELEAEIAPTGKQKNSRLRFRFPPQETTFTPGAKVRAPKCDDPAGGGFGEVVSIDFDSGVLEVTRSKKAAGIVPSGLFAGDVVGAKDLEKALRSLAETVRDQGLEADGTFRAGCDLLRGRPPRLRSGFESALQAPGEDALASMVRLCRELDGGVLPIQGPPGAGKTYVGARTILELIREGKRVGITAVSHKVIDNLLAEVGKAAAEARQPVELVHRDAVDAGSQPPGITYVDKAAALQAVQGGAVVGGTAWLWASDVMRGALDYLFVDEAGQLSLAHTLAASGAARNLVLLGDPQQLEQPHRGAHPDGTDVAALVHLIGPERATLTDDQGLFLDRTYRLNPDLCAFTSEVYYDGRLQSVDGRDKQRIGGPIRFAGAGLYLVEVSHEGNQARSDEEVAAVTRITRDLLQDGATWTNADGEIRPLKRDDVLIVAPYNAQVAALKRALPGLRIGTVDKFQGQEAPVVVYSCTSSSPVDAPRGMDFLYDSHRFNVATSRGKAAVIVVASPRLFEPECRTTRQLQLANAFCRFREMARIVHL